MICLHGYHHSFLLHTLNRILPPFRLHLLLSIQSLHLLLSLQSIQSLHLLQSLQSIQSLHLLLSLHLLQSLLSIQSLHLLQSLQSIQSLHSLLQHQAAPQIHHTHTSRHSHSPPPRHYPHFHTYYLLPSLHRISCTPLPLLHRSLFLTPTYYHIPLSDEGSHSSERKSSSLFTISTINDIVLVKPTRNDDTHTTSHFTHTITMSKFHQVANTWNHHLIHNSSLFIILTHSSLTIPLTKFDTISVISFFFNVFN